MLKTTTIRSGKSFRVLMSLVLLCAAVVMSGTLAAQDDAMPDYTRGGADDCLRCHTGEEYEHLMPIFDGPHGVKTDSRSPFGSLQCEACHGPGGDHAGRIRRGQERPPMPAFGPNALWSRDKQNQICIDCHREQDHRFWEGSQHQIAEVGCADCHQSHARVDPMRIATEQNESCMSCHVEQRAEFHRAFTHPVRFGELSCSDCHQPHGAATEAMLSDFNLNQNCYGCHADKRGPFLWEHAPVAEDCSNCHRPHGSNHPALLTRRAPLLCQQCHSRAGHPSIGLTPDDIGPNLQSVFLLSGSCTSCHSQVHGSNHPSGAILNR